MTEGGPGERILYVSYRPGDNPAMIGRIYDRLVERYGREHVALSRESDATARAGAPMERAFAALALIGPKWLADTTAAHRGALTDPDDPVRRDIEAALRLGRPIIPVQMGATPLPMESRLPASVRPLLRQNAVPVRSDPDFSRDIERLLASVDYWAVHEPAPPPPPEPVPVTASPAQAAGIATRSARRTGAWRGRLTLAIALVVIVALAAGLALRFGGAFGALGAPESAGPRQTPTLTAAERTFTAQSPTHAYGPVIPGPSCAPNTPDNFWTVDAPTSALICAASHVVMDGTQGRSVSLEFNGSHGIAINTITQVTFDSLLEAGSGGADSGCATITLDLATGGFASAITQICSTGGDSYRVTFAPDSSNPSVVVGSASGRLSVTSPIIVSITIGAATWAVTINGQPAFTGSGSYQVWSGQASETIVTRISDIIIVASQGTVATVNDFSVRPAS